MGLSPRVGEKWLHAIPALAPEVPTQTMPWRREAATVLGNSPGTETGGPRRESWEGSEAEMASMLRVLEPALTAKRSWEGLC